jgi:NAD(P)-dependent dehydrogenase (short-subunit alcohol dehydrogenase family)
MAESSSFAGRHVFVAGGTSGINLGIAQAFARAGAHVVVMSRSPDKVQQAAEGLRALGAQALGISADVRDPAAVDAALDLALGDEGEEAFDLVQPRRAGRGHRSCNRCNGSARRTAPASRSTSPQTGSAAEPPAGAT